MSDRLDFGKKRVWSAGLGSVGPEQREGVLDSTHAAMDATRLQRERELYLRLLDLGHREELGLLLKEALRLAVDATGAEQGYIELDTDGEPEWAIAHSCSDEDVAHIRARTSRGIVIEALAQGTLIHTPSALLDGRFSENDSVREKRIEAVICAPIGGKGGERTPVGVLYLQRKSGAGPFSEADVDLAKIFAYHVAPVLTHLQLSQRAANTGDPTRPWREKLQVENIIGRSKAIAEVLKNVSTAAPTNLAVLITGPTGAGKSQLARAIHDNSSRRGKPFIEMSCANLIDTLADSQLFGSVPGGFTDAQRTPGAVANADGGTLFLDEIGELPLAVQAKLFTLLTNKTYTPVGGRPAPANIRLITATNADLEARVKERRFREELLYRINVMPIAIPSLAERREDIPLLIEYFADLAAKTNEVTRLPVSNGARLAIISADWAGNVRELETFVTRGVVRAHSENASQIEARHLFPEAKVEPAQLTYQEQMSRCQKDILQRALDETGWNVVETTKRLDLSRARIYDLIRLHGLQRHSS